MMLWLVVGLEVYIPTFSLSEKQHIRILLHKLQESRHRCPPCIFKLLLKCTRTVKVIGSGIGTHCLITIT